MSGEPLHEGQSAPPAGVRVERPLTPPPDSGQRVPPPAHKGFRGELAGSFEEALEKVQWENQGRWAFFLRLIVSVSQPFLGAMAHSAKMALEEAVGDRRFFTAAGATGLNILLNMLLYPMLMGGVTALLGGGELFSQDVNSVIFLGVAIALAEAVVRLREGVFEARPIDQVSLRPCLYGIPLGWVAMPLLRSFKRTHEHGRVAFDGYYRDGFDEKIERERRYGQVYTLQEAKNAYLLWLEFPRLVPPSSWKKEWGIPDAMPDYDYDISVHNGTLVVTGRVSDSRVRKLSSMVAAFPPEFTTRVTLKEEVAAFRHRYLDKTIHLILFKQE